MQFANCMTLVAILYNTLTANMYNSILQLENMKLYSSAKAGIVNKF